MSNTDTEYTVYAHLHLEVAKKIVATSMADAVERSKGLSELDFVKIKPNEFCDGEMEITGVYSDVPLR